jgi:hypothetical protein
MVLSARALRHGVYCFLLESQVEPSSSRWTGGIEAAMCCIGVVGHMEVWPAWSRGLEQHLRAAHIEGTALKSQSAYVALICLHVMVGGVPVAVL